jgi:hypothetical protein
MDNDDYPCVDYWEHINIKEHFLKGKYNLLLEKINENSSLRQRYLRINNNEADDKTTYIIGPMGEYISCPAGSLIYTNISVVPIDNEQFFFLVQYCKKDNTVFKDIRDLKIELEIDRIIYFYTKINENISNEIDNKIINEINYMNI